MALAGAWIAFPLVLALLALGWGLLVEIAAGRRLPGALLPGLGVAALAVVMSALTADPATAELTLPVVVGGAFAGLGLLVAGAGPRTGLAALRPTPATAATGVAAAAVYLAPVVLSGAPAISGYIRLDDSATWIAIADHVLTSGRDVAGLAPSTHQAALASYLSSFYPAGSLLPLAAAGRLAGQDLAWVWAPYLGGLGVALALALSVLLRAAVPQAAARVAVAVCASASALLFGYVLWGGVKEVAIAALTATAAALVPWTLAGLTGERRATWGSALRALSPLAVCAAAIASTVSIAGVVWIGPVLAALVLGAIAGVGGARRALHAVREAAAARGRVIAPAIGAAVVAVVLIAVARREAAFVRGIAGDRGADDLLGNLIEPLRLVQVLGVWPSGDFRVDPAAGWPTALILLTVVLAAGLGVARIAALRAWGLLAYAGTLLAAAAVLAVSSWPWAEAKTLAIASPVPLTLAGVGVAHLLQTRARALGVAAGVLVAGGVAWSNALAFHETTLTPRERHAELERIGERFAGRGPALLPEYDPYGARWFLRRMDAEGASELRPRTVALAEGGTLAKTETADLDRFSLDALREYRTLVVRRSPAASRPPSWFSRVWRGRWYEVWERTGDAGRVVGRLGLGTELDPAGTARCSDVRRLARAAGPGGRLLAATAPAPVVGTLGPGGAPGSWTTAAAGNAVVPDGDGSVRTTVTLPQAGRWAVWLGGAFRGRVRVSIDGRRAGVDRHQLSYDGQWVPFGSLDLVAGPHAVTVSSDEDALRPGSGGGDFAIGPVAFSPATGGRAVLAVPAGRAERLCDRRLDWIDAVR